MLLGTGGHRIVSEVETQSSCQFSRNPGIAPQSLCSGDALSPLEAERLAPTSGAPPERTSIRFELRALVKQFPDPDTDVRLVQHVFSNGISFDQQCGFLIAGERAVDLPHEV